jgi:hypothetical protein
MAVKQGITGGVMDYQKVEAPVCDVTDASFLFKIVGWDYLRFFFGSKENFSCKFIRLFLLVLL